MTAEGALATTFLAGIVAGYGIAIPIGAIGLLIIDAGIRHGLAIALAAGAGAATADLAYAAVAAVFGVALAGVIAPIETPLRIAAVAVLVAIAGRGLMGLVPTAGPGAGRREGSVPAGGGAPSAEPDERTPARTYVTFVGLTLLNPATVTYFAALIVGLTATGAGVVEKAAFVAGAGLSSLSWQWLLAGVGALAHERLPARLRLAVGVVGYLIILGFAVTIAIGLIPD